MSNNKTIDWDEFVDDLLHYHRRLYMSGRDDLARVVAECLDIAKEHIVKEEDDD